VQTKPCVCGADIPLNRSLCADCLQRYGRRASEWPDWVRWLVRDRQRELDADRYHDELALDDGGAGATSSRYPSEMGDAGIDVAWRWIRSTRHSNDSAPQPNGRPLRTADVMRYAPYADEASNREYRRANGIKERNDRGGA
jgi:hypothetical protein